MTIFHIPPKINSRLREKERLKPYASDTLPTFANGLHEKHTLRRYRNLTSTFYVPVPWPFSRCIRVRHFKIILPIPAKASKYMARTRWKGFNHFVALISIVLLFWNLYNFMRSWPSLPFKPKKTTLVFSQEDVRRIWEWEVASGHYQSRRSCMCDSRLVVSDNIDQLLTVHHSRSWGNHARNIPIESRNTSRINYNDTSRPCITKTSTLHSWLRTKKNIY